MATQSAEALLQGLVDYAGMYPPASLELHDAMSVYARYRAGPDAWMVGAFVIAAERLDDLDQAPGPLSVVVAATSPGSLGPVLNAAARMTVAALEFRPVAPDAVAGLAAAVPGNIQAFFEVPSDTDLERRLDAIAACGASAKIRTGGITVDAFPSAASVHRFLRACADRGIAAKATAGLHHAVAGPYPLTYDARSPRGSMFGFLNLSVAAALVHSRATIDDVLAALGELSSEAFAFDGDGMEWRGHRMSTDDLRAMRQRLFRSFGSCSLQEPIDDLKRMRIV